MTHILYNPTSGNNSGKGYAMMLEICYPDSASYDVTQIADHAAFFAGLAPSDDVILCGGDGMLHHFANDVKNIAIPNRIYLYAMGTGNDFARDIGKSQYSEPDYPINAYIKKLPSVTVNGTQRLFINGVGYGIDGYCCEVGDKLREQNQKLQQDKPINYASIAIKGLMGKFKPVNATVTVDGKKYQYKNVWIAPTMK
ncbi:MAG: diacylglycerol kinase family protein, partial [Clostridia bacterium]|nr:diacylglycerol kinase family protein [Clostridia bacterium]